MIERMEYEVYLQDIDPDSGDISQEVTVAFVINKPTADFFKEKLQDNDDTDPNRNYLIRKNLAK